MIELKKLILLGSIFILLLSSHVNALNYGNLEVYLIKNDLYGVSYTPQCLGTCYLPLNFSWHGSSFTMQRSDLGYIKNQLIGADKLQDISLMYLANDSYQDWVSNIVCVNGTQLGNGTIPQTCSDNGYYQTLYRMIWKSVPANIPIQKDRWYQIDLIGTLNIGLDASGVDIVPLIKGIQLSGFAWWNSNWQYRMNSTIKSSVSTNEILPRNVTLNTFDMINAGKLQSACQDLRITDGTDAEIPFYIESGCGTTNTTIWYLTTTKADNSSLIWVYYGNPAAADGQNKNGVFDANYKVAYDMGEGTGSTFDDGTSNNNDATLTSGGWAKGMFGNASAYNGASSVASSNSNIASGETAFTLEGWLYIINGTDLGAYLSKGFTYSTEQRQIVIMRYDSQCSGGIDITIRNSTAEYTQPCLSERPTNKWIYIVGRWNGTYVDIFLNGTLRSSFGMSVLNTYNTRIKLMELGEGNYWSGGYADNVRYSNTARTNNNLKMTYDTATQSSLATAWGTQQTYSGANGTSIILLLNSSASPLTLIYPQAVNETAIINTTGLWVALFRNGTLLGNGTTSIINTETVGSGYHNITAVYNGNNSFYGSNATLWLTVNQNPNQDLFCINNGTANYCNIYAGGCTGTHFLTAGGSGLINMVIWNTYPNPTNISMSSAVGSVAMWLDNISITAYNNLNTIYGAGWYVAGGNTTSNANYSYNCSEVDFRINKGTPTLGIGFNTSSSVTQGTPVNVSCSATQDLSVNLYNDSGVTTNPLYLNTNSLLGLYNYTCNTTGNANYTNVSTSKSLTVVLTGAFIITQVLDEKTQTPLTFNVTIYNSTYSVTQNNINSYNNNQVQGALTVAITRSGYIQRNYYVNVQANSTTNITGYLLDSSSGVYVTYWAYSTVNPVAEPGAYIQFYRFIGTGFVDVAESQADFQGKGTMYLDPYGIYNINAVTLDGSLTKNLTSYNPNPSFILQISFGGTTTGNNITGLWVNTNYSLTPTDVYLRNSSILAPISYTISDGSNAIQWYALRLVSSNGTVLYFSNQTSPSGGTIAVNLNYSGLTNYVVMQTFLQKQGFALFSANRTLIIFKTSSAIPDALNAVASSGLSLPVLAVIAVFVSFGIASTASRFVRTGAGLIYLAVMLIFSYYGFFPLGMMLGLGMLEVGIILYKEAY